MSIHTDFEGPLLFIGGHVDGERRSVNASRDVWQIPHPERATLRPGDPLDGDVTLRVDTYIKRVMLLGSRSEEGIRLTVMVWDQLDEGPAYSRALEHIATTLGGTVQRSYA